MTGAEPPSFGDLLRGWRERALLSQEEFGAKAGLDPRTLRRWESGESSRPRAGSLRQVSEILGLSDDEAAELAAAGRGAARTGGTMSTVPDRPQQLPPAPSHFVGRQEELDALRAQVAAGRSVIAVEGMAGVGKTAFAIQAGRLLAPDFADGQLFLDLHGFSDRTRPLGPDEALARLMRALSVPGDQLPVDLEECAGLFRSLVADRRLLLVYDNVAAAGQIVPLLPATASCQVITTSRHRLASLDRGATIRLDTLPRMVAIDLFARASESAEPPETDAEQLTEAVELCGRLPLALRIAAARLRSRPSWQVADLVQRLREQRATVLDRLDDQTQGVSAALDLSYAALDEPTRRGYRLIGLIPGPDVDAAAAASLFGTDHAAAHSALETLQDLHLIDEAPVGRFHLHDLTRTHAAQHARAIETAADRSAALVRLLDHYRAWASAAMDLAHPYTRSRRPDPPYPVTPAGWTVDRANSWLDTELPNILAAARAAREHGLPRYVVELAGTVHRRLIMRHQLGEADVLHRMALQAAEDLGDRAASARAHQNLGRLRRHQQDYPAAARHLDQALSLAEAEGLTLVQVEARVELAATVRYGGSSVDADEHFARALRLAQDVGDELGQLEAHTAIGHARLNEGAYRSAAGHFGRALTLARQVGYRAREVNALIGRGRADAELGRPAAVDGFRRAALLARREGLPIGELSASCNLGNILRRGGDPAAALESYGEVLEIARRTGNRNWQYESHQGMGRAYADLGDGRAALEHHEQARLLAERRRLRADLARAEDGLGDASGLLGRADEARRHWQAALDLLAEVGVDHTDDPETTRTAISAKLGRSDG